MRPELRQRIFRSKTFKTILALTALYFLGLILDRIIYAYYDALKHLTEAITQWLLGIANILTFGLMTKWFVEEAIGDTGIPWWKTLFKYAKEYGGKLKGTKELWSDSKTFIQQSRFASASLQAELGDITPLPSPYETGMAANVATLYHADSLTRLKGHWPAIIGVPLIWLVSATLELPGLMLLTAGAYAAAWWALSQLSVESDVDETGHRRVFIDTFAGLCLTAVIATAVMDGDGLLTWLYLYMMSVREWTAWPRQAITARFTGKARILADDMNGVVGVCMSHGIMFITLFLLQQMMILLFRIFS